MNAKEFSKIVNTQEKLLREIGKLWDCTNPENQVLVHKIEMLLLDEMKATNKRAFDLGLIKPIY
jgi:hypothetical protein